MPDSSIAPNKRIPCIPSPVFGTSSFTMGAAVALGAVVTVAAGAGVGVVVTPGFGVGVGIGVTPGFGVGVGVDVDAFRVNFAYRVLFPISVADIPVIRVVNAASLYQPSKV